MAQMTVTPLSPACGAIIDGVDLSGVLSNRVVADIRQALHDHLVIFFRNQDLSREEHKAFGRRFGTLNVHPQYLGLETDPEILPVLKEADVPANIGGVWHSDVSNLPEPPMGSILYGHDVPPVGGDTMFANQYLAFESLSSGMRALMEGMKAVHSSRALTDTDSVRAQNATRSTKLREDLDPVADRIDSVHPVVRTHPETGRKALFVNRAFTVRFDGMTEEESAPLLDVLYQHSARPEFTCRFRWEPGSLAFWDNRCVMHYALNDYPGHRRYMERVTVNGDRPF